MASVTVNQPVFPLPTGIAFYLSFLIMSKILCWSPSCLLHLCWSPTLWLFPGKEQLGFVLFFSFLGRLNWHPDINIPFQSVPLVVSRISLWLFERSHPCFGPVPCFSSFLWTEFSSWTLQQAGHSIGSVLWARCSLSGIWGSNSFGPFGCPCLSSSSHLGFCFLFGHLCFILC